MKPYTTKTSNSKKYVYCLFYMHFVNEVTLECLIKAEYRSLVQS